MIIVEWARKEGLHALQKWGIFRTSYALHEKKCLQDAVKEKLQSAVYHGCALKK